MSAIARDLSRPVPNSRVCYAHNYLTANPDQIYFCRLALTYIALDRRKTQGAFAIVAGMIHSSTDISYLTKKPNFERAKTEG